MKNENKPSKKLNSYKEKNKLKEKEDTMQYITFYYNGIKLQIETFIKRNKVKSDVD